MIKKNIRMLALAFVVVFLPACVNTLDVRTDPSQLPSRAEAVAWLNDYAQKRRGTFRGTEKEFRNARYTVQPYNCDVKNTKLGTLLVECTNAIQGTSGIGRATRTVKIELARFNPENDAEAIAIIERLMVLGVTYASTDPIAPKECFKDGINCPSGLR